MADDVQRFIEGFALELSASGMQRMAARVFSALLTAPDGGLTAREIGELLGVSPAAVSGANNYLTQAKLVTRRRIPGERIDRYDVLGTQWASAMTTETRTIESLADLLEQGRAAVPADSAAHERIDSTLDFFRFLVEEMPKLVDRWNAEREAGVR